MLYICTMENTEQQKLNRDHIEYYSEFMNSVWTMEVEDKLREERNIKLKNKKERPMKTIKKLAFTMLLVLGTMINVNAQEVNIKHSEVFKMDLYGNILEGSYDTPDVKLEVLDNKVVLTTDTVVEYKILNRKEDRKYNIYLTRLDKDKYVIYVPKKSRFPMTIGKHNAEEFNMYAGQVKVKN